MILVKNRSIRSIIFVPICLLIMLFYLSCGSGGGDGQGDKNNNNGGADNGTPIASDIIGPEGGTVEAGDFLLTVPAGAFNSDVNLELYETSDTSPYDTNIASRKYLIKGIPAIFSEPLQLKVKYEGSLSNKTMIALGQGGLNDNEMQYIMLPASESSGYLYCELPALGDASIPNGTLSIYQHVSPSQNAGSDSADTGRNIFAVTDIKEHETDHFLIRYKNGLKDFSPQSFADRLEYIYGEINKMGFDYQGKKSRMEVNAFESNFEFGSDLSCFVPYYEFLEIIPYSGSEYSLELLVRLELLHWILSSYDPSYNTLKENSGSSIFSVYKVNPPHVWFAYAAASALLHQSEVFSKFNYYIIPYEDYKERNDSSPVLFPLPEIFKLPNIHSVAKNMLSLRQFGMYMQYMMEYAMDNYGKNIIHDIYKTEIQHVSHPLSALIKKISDPVSVWWPGFIKEYFSKNYAMENANVKDIWNIESKSDTVKEFTDTYKDMSANYYAVNLGAGSSIPPEKIFSDNTKIKFKITSPISAQSNKTILVFGTKTVWTKQGSETVGELERNFLASGTKSVTINNIKDLVVNSDYSNLDIVVVNSNYVEPDFSGSTSITLKIKVLKDIAWGQVSFVLRDKFTSIWLGDLPPYTDDIYFTSDMVNGDFDGEEFEAVWNNRPIEGGTSSGRLWVIIDFDHIPSPVVTFYEFNETRITEHPSIPDETETFIHELKGTSSPKNIPDVITQGDDSLVLHKFRVEGGETCGKIDKVRKRYEVNYPSLFWSENIGSPICDSQELPVINPNITFIFGTEIE